MDVSFKEPRPIFRVPLGFNPGLFSSARQGQSRGDWPPETKGMQPQSHRGHFVHFQQPQGSGSFHKTGKKKTRGNRFPVFEKNQKRREPEENQKRTRREPEENQKRTRREPEGNQIFSENQSPGKAGFWLKKNGGIHP